MKSLKNLILIIFLTVFFSCSKYSLEKRPLSEGQKIEYLKTIKEDPLFLEYIKSVAENYNKMAVIISKSKIDSVQFSKAQHSSNYSEWLSQAKAAGLNNPEEFLKNFKDSPVKLREIYQKYPLLQTQFSQQEQQNFISGNLKLTYKK